MQRNSLFTHRIAVLATMHQKEKAIAPILAAELGIQVIVPQNFNTDAFGTFTRDVQRPGNQITTARLKAKKALELTGESLALASEGSFVPHPSIPFISTNREIVILLDTNNNLEIIGEEFSLETNHSHIVVESIDQTLQFAKKIGFPEHGLVVMFSEYPEDSQQIIKGITTEKQLVEAVNFVIANSPTGKAHLETDMRAMYNPTRMNNIAKATQDLIRKIQSCCPQCSTPGFEVIERIPGLPCAMCGMPTALTLNVIYQCQKCGFSQEKVFPNGIEYAEPAQCMYCNP
ncbi:MAG: DUF6671 family protein [Nostoc sp. ZfuVER08]|uniref:DUF6671 domain-containing protein n=1 Tax=Nostoc punctiforme FACHB-252 TaxID=1357509 RepID=A0ABR8H7H8_NOSPU|nr:DUF6671 family protein [Nostoc punctiforme]MBD2611703.1 hypothetical protein [Nostoc punctiforme FACHB-252]MDZ8014243.1 hypothetical protein [Nostoc sp. ZfuVER08]